MKNKTYTIKNTSKYSTAYLKCLIDFAIKHTEIGSFYKLPITVKNKNYGGYSGYAYHSGEITLNFNRKKKSFGNYPRNIADRRYKYSPVFIVHNRTEYLLHVIAHEIYHIVDPNIETASSSRTEFVANDHSYKVVRKFREEQETAWKKIMKDMRKEHKANNKILENINKEKAKRKKKKEALKQKMWEKKEKHKSLKQIRNTVEYKLEKFKKLRNKWDKKWLTAQTHYEKYDKKVKYYEKAVAKSKI